MPPETIDSLDKDGLKPLLLELLAQNKALTEQISVLVARIAELEARNGQPPKTPPKTSANSSLPPSSGHKANAAPPAHKKRRKGRAGVARELCANPDEMRDVYPLRR